MAAAGAITGAVVGGTIGGGIGTAALPGGGTVILGAGGALSGAGLGATYGGLIGLGRDLLSAGRLLFADDAADGGAGAEALPGEGDGWTKLRGNQGWRDADGNGWQKDKKHKDHWDVSDRKGNKIREVDFKGRRIWPDGPKNKNKTP